MQKHISTLVGIIIIVAVAGVLFGGVFAYQYFSKSQQNSEFFGSSQKTNQTQTQTAGWKTFVSDKYNFEIKIPTNELLSSDDISMQERGFIYQGTSYKEIFVATLKYGCDLYVYPDIDNNFLSLRGNEDFSRPRLILISENNGKKYSVAYRVASSAVNVNECTPVFEEILPTFKFTK